MGSIDIIEPVPLPYAFSDITELGEYSRAAFLLSLGIFLNPPSYGVREDLLESPPFPLPEISPLSARISTAELSNLFRQYDFDLDKFTNDSMMIDEYAEDMVKRIYSSSPEERWAPSFQLLAIFMNHHNELLRVSAAISWLDTVTDPSKALEILLTSVKSEYDLVRNMAYTALARVMGGSDVPKRTIDFGPTSQPHALNAESIIVHGSVFSHPGKPYEKWWEPGTGDFHNYLKNGPRPNVYNASDYFWWSGGWNDDARFEGAAKLMGWIDKHDMHGVDVFAHSHGCNITMLATWYKKLGSLILMSSPVHWNLYQPNFRNVDRVLSIRVLWDFIIMADKGGQRFRDPRITETILPLWFTAHDEPRKSTTWRKRNLDQLL